jgi:hypothetical protein
MNTKALKKMHKKIKFYYRPLHSWNYFNEVSLVDAQLAKRNVHYYFISSDEQETKIYLIPDSEIKKLPFWEGEPYLPVEEDWGHSLFMGNLWERDYNNCDWKEILAR